MPGLPRLQSSFGIELTDASLKRSIPRLAKNPEAVAAIEQAVHAYPTRHNVYLGDARRLDFLDDNSVQLVVTSPPYWTLKEYVGCAGQLGDIEQYDEFVEQLASVWRHCFRVLDPGGRMIIVVGDVCLSRRKHGRHAVVPLHASIQESCRSIGYDNLSPIIWHKIANAQFEAEGSGGFLGKPYEPNAVIKNDIEYILMQRKPGGYRSPSAGARLLSLIAEPLQRAWFRQIWTLPGASTRDHPAPFPVALAERLIRMYSFVGDTVLDPFLGSGSSMIAAAQWGRSSIGVEIEQSYLRHAVDRIHHSIGELGQSYELIENDSSPTAR